MFTNLTVKNRLFYLIGLMTFVMITLTSWNLYALHQTNNGLKTVYLDRTVPVADLEEIKAKQIDIRLKIANAINAPTEAKRSLDKIKAARNEIDMLWEKYARTEMTPEEKKLADSFVVARQKYVSDGLDLVLAQISKQDRELA